MAFDKAAGESTVVTQEAAAVLSQGLEDLLRAQLTVAGGDVVKAAAVTEAVARELECMRKDATSINQYCRECENKVAGSSTEDGVLTAAFAAIDECYEESMMLEDLLGQLEGQMASLEERWGRLKR